MIGLDFDSVELQLTSVRFKQLAERIRRQVLQKVGNEAADLLIEPIRQADVPVVTGNLKNAVGKKVKVYPRKSAVFVAVGAKSKKVVKGGYEYYLQRELTKGIKRQRVGARKAGRKPLNPVNYAHLAGPDRKAMYIQVIERRMRHKVAEKIVEVMVAEVSKL